ncbi:Myc-type, basic helix-loop-helix domain-containing protein [Tanacetum coccineum]
MSTYLKNMAGYKHNQLKTKSFEDIQMLFDKEMKRVNTFVDMDTELVKGSEIRTEGSSKRAGEELESENLKKQKLEAEVDDDQEEAEMKMHMKIVHDDEVAIDAIPLATKPNNHCILEKIGRDTVRDGEIPKTVIAMKGVLYEHYTRYRHCLENTLRELVSDQLAKHIELIIHSNDVGCIGAALLAASHSQYL